MIPRGVPVSNAATSALRRRSPRVLRAAQRLIRTRAEVLAKLAPTGNEASDEALAHHGRWRRLRRTEKNGLYISELAMMRRAKGDFR